MQHQDPAVAVPFDEILDRTIPYSIVPTVHGVPLSRRVVDAFDLVDEALVIAREAKPGLTVGDLVADIRAARVTR